MQEYKMNVENNGDKFWKQDDNLQRNTAPIIEFKPGNKDHQLDNLIVGGPEEYKALVG